MASAGDGATGDAESASHRPRLGKADVEEVCRRFGFAVTSQTDEPGYDTQNVIVDGTVSGAAAKAVLKVSNGGQIGVVLQNTIAEYLADAGIRVPPLYVAVASDPPSTLLEYRSEADGPGPAYSCRLLGFVNGPLLADVYYTPRTLSNLGAEMGRMLNALQRFTFPHPTSGVPACTPVNDGARALMRAGGGGRQALPGPPWIWHMANSLDARPKLGAIKSDVTRAHVASTLDEFEAIVLPALEKLRVGWIHGDLNDRNIIMTPVAAGRGKAEALPAAESARAGADGTPFQVGSFIDFEDVGFGPLVCEAAIALAYAMMRGIEPKPEMAPLDIALNMFEGFSSQVMLPDLDMNCLLSLTKTRLAVSITMSAETVLADPANEEYLMVHARPGMALLAQLVPLDYAATTAQFVAARDRAHSAPAARRED